MKKILLITLCAVMVFCLFACGDENAQENEDIISEEEITSEEVLVPEDSWSVYWYLCGSDLETNNACATADLMELMEVALPENVNIVIQTGGAALWQNEFVDASKTQRWVYNSEGLTLLEELDVQNMGDAQTLYEFLEFANTNFPAEKVAVTFWNHGGGSVSGAAFDENFGNDSLDLNEMYSAFDAVWPAAGGPALELVGFDTCLMATVDVASTFSNFANYLVASQEVEPGNGWLYSGLASALADDPAIDGAEFGRAICDSYYQGCEQACTHDQATLSVTDLSKIGNLLSSYETFGEEAFALAAEAPDFLAEFARCAIDSENYGGNTREQGYTNMVDLGHLARNTAWMLPSAEDVLSALDECVIYKVGGQYRSEATGLSCYYSYNGDINDLNGYIMTGASTAFKHLYAYSITGEMAGGGEEYLETLDIPALPEILNLTDMGWDGTPLDVDENGTAYMTLGEQAGKVLAGIGFSLYYIDSENDRMMLLGTDNDMTADWENGVFSDNFRGVWGAIDGNIVYMELSQENESYNIYSVPILLNGEEYNLQVVYDFTSESWGVLGAAPGLTDDGMAAKELRLLEVGDVITTICKLATYSGDDDFEMYTMADVVITEETTFGEVPLTDGEYSMVFEMRDAQGNYCYSDAVTFSISGGEITTTVYED